MKTVTRFFKDESGVTAIEYGLIAALISVVCITAMTFAGKQLLAVYDQIGTALQTALQSDAASNVATTPYGQTANWYLAAYRKAILFWYGQACGETRRRRKRGQNHPA
jgi:pilus assembly protein Flp/PilA